MPKDYTGERIRRILKPSDPGFNDPRTPWGGIRNVVGWKKPEAIKLPIAGFYLIDRRMKPAIAIFKNACIVGRRRLRSGEDPIPFNSLEEVLMHKEKMHLSSSDADKVKPVALVPDPGLGNYKPNIMWIDKKTARSM